MYLLATASCDQMKSLGEMKQTGEKLMFLSSHQIKMHPVKSSSPMLLCVSDSPVSPEWPCTENTVFITLSVVSENCSLHHLCLLITNIFKLKKKEGCIYVSGTASNSSKRLLFTTSDCSNEH